MRRMGFTECRVGRIPYIGARQIARPIAESCRYRAPQVRTTHPQIHFRQKSKPTTDRRSRTELTKPTTSSTATPRSPVARLNIISTYTSPILKLEYVSLIIDKDDKLVGVGISLPSMSRALQKGRGRLFPTGWYHLLKAMYRYNDDTVDLLLVGVSREYQSKRGVNSLLFTDLLPTYIKNRVRWAETNPELAETRMCSSNGDSSTSVSTAAALHSRKPI